MPRRTRPATEHVREMPGLGPADAELSWARVRAKTGARGCRLPRRESEIPSKVGAREEEEEAADARLCTSQGPGKAHLTRLPAPCPRSARPQPRECIAQYCISCNTKSALSATRCNSTCAGGNGAALARHGQALIPRTSARHTPCSERDFLIADRGLQAPRPARNCIAPLS